MMLEPWNDASILPPPILTTPVLDNDSKLSLKKLQQVIKNIITILSKQSPLHRESALLSRFLYKFDKKFRNDIGYQNFKKVNTALRKYLALNLINDFEYINSILPSSEQDNLYLPTRQLLEYILVRIMTFSKIMARVFICSKRAAIFYMDRIKRAESHWMSLMPYALLSRLWSVSSLLIQHATTWYTELYTFLNKLKLKGVNFLPAGYELPTDIEIWLDLKNIEEYKRFNWSVKKQVQVDSRLLESDGDISDSILDYIKQITNEESEDTNVPDTFEEKTSQLLEMEISTPNIDKGESVSREYFKSFFNSQSSGKKYQYIHLAVNVTNKDSLRKFLCEEESFRNSSDKKSLTKHLSFMQWQSLKSALVKLSESLAKNRKIERKFQQIWKEKCLDYM